MKNLLFLSLLTLGTLIPTSATADEKLSHFSMELSGDVITDDVSGNHYNVECGSLRPLNMAGARGEALRFDGYSNYIVAKLPDQTLSQLTFSVWCAIEGYPMMNTNEAENTVTYSTIAGNVDDNAKTGMSLMLSSQGDLKVRFYTGGWGPYEIMASEKLPRTQWNHLVVILDGAKTLSLYNNGQFLGSSKTMGSIALGNADFYIGKSPEALMQGQFHINAYCGLIDDISLYSSAVSSLVADNTPDNAPCFRYPASRYDSNDYARLWRPSFHAIPSGSWTNECHGMTFSNGRFHLFFQKNPNGPYMARLNWGHLSSENLYDWREENIAFGPSEDYDIKGCWSGCVLTDETLTGGTPMAFYTAVDNGKASISTASPQDSNLESWTKKGQVISGRPSTLTDDFRDCYVFSHDGDYYMIVGSSQNDVGVCSLHKYENGLWTNDGSIFFKGASKNTAGRFWEMPNVTQLEGENYLFTATPLETSMGVETLYWIGTINEDGTFNTFTPTASPGKVELDGFSKDGFGLLSPTVFQKDGSTIALGIVPDKLESSYNYQIGWAHNYSLPREWTLQDGELRQKPYTGLKAMRELPAYSLTDESISTAQELGNVKGRAIEVEANFVVGGNTFGLSFLNAGSSGAKLTYNPSTNMLKLDMTDVPRISNDAGTFDGVYSSVLPVKPAEGEIFKMHVFFDHSIFDIFINDRWAASVRIFPTDETADGVSVLVDGETHIKSLNAWTLDPEQATAIEFVTSGQPAWTTKAPRSYNLAGQCVNASYKGIVIKNGKKIICK